MSNEQKTYIAPHHWVYAGAIVLGAMAIAHSLPGRYVPIPQGPSSAYLDTVTGQIGMVH